MTAPVKVPDTLRGSRVLGPGTSRPERAGTHDALATLVVTRDDPGALPDAWAWTGGGRLDAAGLGDLVPDLAERHAYISGPPSLIADLAPALGRARSLTTDAFSGY